MNQFWRCNIKKVVATIDLGKWWGRQIFFRYQELNNSMRKLKCGDQEYDGNKGHRQQSYQKQHFNSKNKQIQNAEIPIGKMAKKIDWR